MRGENRAARARISEVTMTDRETLVELGVPREDIAEYARLEEHGRYALQERILRRYRSGLLDNIHRDEARIARLDTIIFELDEKKRGG